ncbi:GFA family protein [Candidatus Poribacteria bacterium]|jgi:hypothetical protein|nr:GFA family protein [Candidatus Poribacteria bacterium]MBT5533958.1 GFA family protein [Candidatus Poribacteria bacterium]MBT5714308.1 GFA family protein [Candidatus Poribacteria bacterium]MBT7807018.1 GFA family protein [Candidatus Poribacteria bacterium]
MAGELIEGGCLCGAVRYRATGPPQHQTMCYCANCRRASGAQSVAWVSVSRGAVEFTRGEPSRYRYAREDGRNIERVFCGDCGTQLTYAADGPDDGVDITTGSLDDPEAYPPHGESWAEEKLSWVKS